jgi:hypothetical protein
MRGIAGVPNEESEKLLDVKIRESAWVLNVQRFELCRRQQGRVSRRIDDIEIEADTLNPGSIASAARSHIAGYR